MSDNRDADILMFKMFISMCFLIRYSQSFPHANDKKCQILLFHRAF